MQQQRISITGNEASSTQAEVISELGFMRSAKLLPFKILFFCKAKGGKMGNNTPANNRRCPLSQNDCLSISTNFTFCLAQRISYFFSSSSFQKKLHPWAAITEHNANNNIIKTLQFALNFH